MISSVESHAIISTSQQLLNDKNDSKSVTVSKDFCLYHRDVMRIVLWLGPDLISPDFENSISSAGFAIDWLPFFSYSLAVEVVALHWPSALPSYDSQRFLYEVE
jgi:hypothetical protein